jgi:hypothetical protein
MKSMLNRIRWTVALIVSPLIVAWHRLGKPQGFEAFGAISGTTFVPVPLLSHDDDPDWKVIRMPFAPGTGPALSTMKPGYLIKFDAARANVNPALPADDAVLEGIIIDVGGTDVANPADTTVAVALNGSFDKNTIKYADGTSPISAAGLARLRDMNIFLDPAIPIGAFAP